MGSHAVYAHNDTGSERRTPNQGRDSAVRKPRTSGGLDALCVAQDERDLAQQVAPGHGRIRGGHGISAGQNRGIVRSFGYHAVNKKAAIAHEEDDVSFRNGFGGNALNDERVPGHDRGQHAPARDAQPQCARRTQYFARQVALQGVSIAQRLRRKFHETFWLLAQAVDVTPILPHERAVVTNTFSKRKDGFS
jgi:hypothetical protein